MICAIHCPERGALGFKGVGGGVGGCVACCHSHDAILSVLVIGLGVGINFYDLYCTVRFICIMNVYVRTPSRNVICPETST